MIYLKIQLFLYTIAISSQISAQTYQWAKSAGGEDLDLATDMVLDANNDMIICGEFKGTADIDPDTSVKEISSLGEREAFLARYNDQGELIWAIVTESDASSWCTARSLALDSEGNILVLGSLRGTVDVDPSMNSETITTSGAITMYLLKFTNTGQLIWQLNWQNSAFFAGVRKLAIDEHDNIYLVGGMASSVDIGSKGVVKTLSAVGKDDAFVSSYNKDGDFRWAFNLGSAEDDKIHSIDIKDGKLVVGGYYGGTMDVDPDLTGFDLLDYNSGVDGFIALYDTSGNYLRSNSISGNSNVRVNAVMFDLFDNVVATGEYRDEIDFIPGFDDLLLNASGGQNVFFAKYNSTGDPVWAKSLGNGHAFVSELDQDKLNQIYLTGAFKDSLDFNPGNGTDMRYSLGGQDIYVAKYSEAGNYIWSGNMEGMGIDDSWQVKVNDTLEVAICGSFESTVDFNPAWGVANFQSLGKGDVFIAKYGPDAISGMNIHEVEINMHIYPNPLVDQLNIVLDQNDKISVVSVFDVQGNKIWHKSLDNVSSATLDLSFLLPGYYLLQVHTATTSLSKRIIKD